jgi:hypothetical protein
VSHKPLLVCVALLALGACAASTTLTSTWAEPTAGRLDYKKILVAFPGDDKQKRLSAEVRMKQRIPGSVTAFSVFDKGEEKDMPRVKEKIKELGFDAVVMMRLVAIETDKTYVPPSTTVYSSGPGMYGYWDTTWVEYDPGYTVEKTVATVETRLFQVEGEKLIWVSRSHSMKPDKVATTIDEIIDANVAAMRKQGLLKP